MEEATAMVEALEDVERRLENVTAEDGDRTFQGYIVTGVPARHSEAFGGVYGDTWVARDKDGERCFLRRPTPTPSLGLSDHGVLEVAILKDLARTTPCQHIMSVADVFALPEGKSWCLYIVSPYASHDLITYMKSQKLNAGSVRSMARQLAIAVDHLHAHEVVHLNLKRANVLVGLGEQLVVCGFGTAARRPPGAEVAEGHQCLRTHVECRPPELFLGSQKTDDWAVDLWGLGCLMGALAVGCSIFYKSSDDEDAYNQPLVKETKEFNYNVCHEMFRRLGFPREDHPLVHLPGFQSCMSQLHDSSRELLGWRDAETLLGGEGVLLLGRLLDLDPGSRITARAALLHTYFVCEDPAPLPGNVRKFRVASAAASVCRTTSASVCRKLYTSAAASAVPGQKVSDSSASQHYLARDLKLERRTEEWYLVAALTIQRRFSNRIGLCQLIRSFLFRSRHPHPDYMVHMSEIRVDTRAMMNDWLVCVHDIWQLPPSTLFLTVDIIDRFLTHNPDLNPPRLNLVALAALLLANKFDDGKIWLSPKFLAVRTHRVFTEFEIMGMEVAVATQLGFGAPFWGAHHFLCRYAAVAPLSSKYFLVARCYLEYSLCVYRCSLHSPSLLACAAYYLAHALQTESWNQIWCPTSSGVQPAAPSWWSHNLEEESGRCEAAVRRCAKELAASLWAPDDPRVDAVRRKFSQESYMKVANLVWDSSMRPVS
eukprot:gnl/TRDRNA2_/TRDRNA2_36894_c0_seq1.p1 gnl/TRDRNA2_/TRDRNA2_36894_c0~~gnl/TRDRNA2_/TRDRNA2_36894_c0_seq1.p1  ORF type:complete len:711 (-),score=91.58 gnl/TRDRNA2_/TRDRNA2_36894_c0_seq1:246-2378(-)